MKLHYALALLPIVTGLACAKANKPKANKPGNKTGSDLNALRKTFTPAAPKDKEFIIKAEKEVARGGTEGDAPEAITR